MKQYDHLKIEKKWQKQWEKDGLYNTKDVLAGKENYYTLVEFPYPSGNLHIGHWYAFAVPDMFARYKRMRGYNVLFPIGFDAFGLPAENAALKNKVDPKKWTYENISRMTEQLKSIGASFDWSRQVITSDSEYYKWTQWLFLQLYKKGLAYRGKAVVNWDPIDMTVLANEQVLPDGTAERSGAVVEKKELEQWFLKITNYAERLIEDLEELFWPEEIKQAQREWIGRSAGALLKFKIQNAKGKSTIQNSKCIEIFTTRPDTLFGATYLVLAPEHKIISDLKFQISNWDEVLQYTGIAARKSELDRQKEDREKTGVKLEGVVAINPANNEEIPIFVADYVLGGYGTGAIMAVPAHDERDFEFARKFGLPIKQVICGNYPKPICPVLDTAYTGLGHLVGSGQFDGLTSKEAKEKITAFVKGKKQTTYKLRDWLISRQRYWGTPIPVVYDPEGKPHPIPEKHLPWLLPTDVDFTPRGESPLASSYELKKRTEKIFGKGWRPEVDSMDTFVDSSWYFLRYADPKNDKEPASKKHLKKWMPVNRYSGGAEHTTMHLLYSRFFHKALFDLGIVNEKEPYLTRMNRGIILGTDGRKMSKRWGNVVDPDQQVKTVGADSVRVYLAFIGPYNTVGQYPWDIGGIAGARRFLERVWKLQTRIKPPMASLAKGGNNELGIKNKELETLMHQTIKKVGEDIESFKFNTAVSALMIYLNALEKELSISKKVYEQLLFLLSPFAPHIAEELWTMIGNKTSIYTEPWPSFEAGKLKAATKTVAVQVNGKVRDTLVISAEAEEEEIKEMALGLDKVSRWVQGRNIRNIIYVQGRVVNIVIGDKTK